MPDEVCGGLRGVGEPPHAQLASLFLMLVRCCASGFRSVKTFLATPAFCTVFAEFSYYKTTCGLSLAVSSASTLKKKCGCCVLPNTSFSPNNTLSEHASIKRRKNAVAAWSKTPVLTSKPYFRGPELVPGKSLQQHHSAVHSSEESYGLASILHTKVC